MAQGEYYIDRGTGKMELHFDKADYMALPTDLRSDIKRYFLFSRGKGAWISKGQADSYAPRNIVGKLGFKKAGEVGEKVSFAEQVERKAERAAERAERYEGYGASARQRQESLQKDFNKFRGDIAFLTQPGRIPWREKIVARYEKGFAEAGKAQHFEEQAERLHKVSTQAQLTNPRYLDNRIKEGEANLRRIERTVEEIKGKGGEVPQHLEDRAHDELDKLVFYKKAMADIGGVKYSQSNVAKGDKVLTRFGWGEVKGTGPKNMKVDSGHGFALTLPYAEIKGHQPQKAAKEVTKPPKEPWQMAVPEWAELSHAQRQTFAGTHPPFPYHSNFHVTQVIDAIKAGKPVPQKVIDSFGKDTGIEQALRASAKPEPRQEVKLLGTPKAPAYAKLDEGDRAKIVSRYGDVPVGREGTVIKSWVNPKTGNKWAKLDFGTNLSGQRLRNSYPTNVLERVPAKSSGTIDDELEFITAHSAATSKGTTYGGRVPIYQGPESKYQGQGEFYYKLTFMPDEPWIVAYSLPTGKGKTGLKPALKAETKPEPKPKKEKEIGILKAKPAKPQSDRALAIDRSLLAMNVVAVDDPRWLTQPNRFDVRGIDTPGSGRKVSRTGFIDKGKTRVSRRHHRGWKKARLA